MTSVINALIEQSAQPVAIPNSIEAPTGNNLSITYTVNGNPSSLVVTVQGLTNGTGDEPIIDSYVGTGNTTRAIDLAVTYDAFLITAVWAGGSNVSVAAAVTLSGGAGATFQGSFSGILTGNGSPQNVVSAPEGSIYCNLEGGSDTTLFVKESGASSASGWVGK